MSEPSLALQKALRARLAGTGALTALVPANAIFDRATRPEAPRCIILGEGYSDFAQPWETFHDHAYADLHVWCVEEGLTVAKSIVGAIRDALRNDPLAVEGFDCRDLQIASSRYLRDPDGLHAHAVVSIVATLLEIA